jgi:hypothetical protein
VLREAGYNHLRDHRKLRAFELTDNFVLEIIQALKSVS